MGLRDPSLVSLSLTSSRLWTFFPYRDHLKSKISGSGLPFGVNYDTPVFETILYVRMIELLDLLSQDLLVS